MTPSVPTAWGRDPTHQFVHETDAVEAFRLAALGEHPTRAGAGPAPAGAPGQSTADRGPWTVDVAGSGVLSLSQAIRRAGRVALPVPGVAGTLPVTDAIVDTTRLRRDFGDWPRLTSAQAFDEFVRAQLPPGIPRRSADG